MKFTSGMEFKILLWGAILLCSPVLSFAQTIVTTDAVKFRGFSNKHNIQGGIPAGKELKVIGKDGPWTLVEYNGTKGRVYSQYTRAGVSAPAATPISSPTSTPSTVATIVTTDAVKFRGYSNKHNIQGGIPAGKELVVLGTDGPWTLVEYNGVKGRVFTRYTDESTPAAPAVAPTPVPSRPATTTTTTEEAPVVSAPITDPSDPNYQNLTVTPDGLFVEPIGGQAIGDSSEIEFRSSPDANATVKKIAFNSTFEIYGRKGDWILVKQGDNFGWISHLNADYNEKIALPEIKATPASAIVLAANPGLKPAPVVETPATTPATTTDVSAADALEETFGGDDAVEDGVVTAYTDENIVAAPTAPTQAEDPNLLESTDGKIYGEVAADLNLREASTGNIIEVLRPGGIVEVLKVQGDWAKVKTEDGQEGWVKHNPYMKLDPNSLTEAGDGLTCAACADKQTEDLKAIMDQINGKSISDIENPQKDCLMQLAIKRARDHAAGSKGLCATYVQWALQYSGLWKNSYNGREISLGDGEDFDESLVSKVGMKNIKENYPGLTVDDAPCNTIIVYDDATLNSSVCGGKSGGRTYGHVEFKYCTADGDERYVSDYDSTNHIQKQFGDNAEKCRPLAGIFVIDELKQVTPGAAAKCDLD